MLSRLIVFRVRWSWLSLVAAGLVLIVGGEIVQGGLSIVLLPLTVTLLGIAVRLLALCARSGGSVRLGQVTQRDIVGW